MGAMEKVKAFLGMEGSLFEEEEMMEEEYYSEPRAVERERPHRSHSVSKHSNKVINIDTTARLNVVIVSPESFEDAQDVANNIKTKRPCVLNLEKVDRSVARRIVDFLSGAVYAVDGNIQRVSTGIFLVTPYNVNILGDFKNELRAKSGLF